MKKSLSLLTIIFGVLIFMMLPIGTMKAEAKGSKIDGTITWDELMNGDHTGDYIGENTVIKGATCIIYYQGETPGYTGDREGGTIENKCDMKYKDFKSDFNSAMRDKPAFYYSNMIYDSFEIISIYPDTNFNYLILKRVPLNDPTLSPVQPTDSTKGSDDTVTACDHDYDWTTVNDATEDCEGLEVCRCTKCGDVCASRSIPKLSDNFSYVTEKYIKQYEQAKSGQTIKLDLQNWNSIPKAFFEELAKRRDITTTIRFIYNHKVYEFTIERGQSVDTSVDYYGPEKLIQLYGAKEVVTK